MRNFMVRQVEERDTAQVAELMAELGYPVPAELMKQKIQEILLSDIDCAYVAEHEGHIIGVISVHALPLFHAAGSLGRITALVVSSAYQRAGVGSKLVEAAEAFARDKGCVKMEVTSGGHREGAHNFYKRAGYEQTAHGRFIRGL
jgi:GNAT superfamily N-acetyltransferase